jgi:hypothetical protein
MKLTLDHNVIIDLASGSIDIARLPPPVSSHSASSIGDACAIL